MTRLLPLQDLVEARATELGVSRSELARRCGFKNINKGLRRIEQVFGGDLNSPSAMMILDALPMALVIQKEIINSAVRESSDLIERDRLRVAAQQDADWRTSFRAHAYLLGSERIPRQIVIYGFTGGPERWLSIPLDLSKPPVTYAAQVLAFVRRTPRVPFHGNTVGFVINYTPDHAVQFDLLGNPVEVLASVYSPGTVQLELGGRENLAKHFSRIIR